MTGLEQYGPYAFLAGVLIAIIAGIAGSFLPENVSGWIPLLLVVLGLVVGFLNIKDKEAKQFLIASIALIAVGGANLSVIPLVGTYLQAIVQGIVVFVAPAALVVGLLAIKKLAADV